MSREIDERIVQMRFDAGSFNRDVQTSIHNLDELKRGLDFKGASKGFEDLDRAARNTDISALGKAAEEVKVKFGLMEVFMLRAMTRISDAAINMGKKLVSSLTVDQVTPGWSKYEQKTSSVQTIMAATAKQFSDTGYQMQVVNEQLEKLNWFTDETSYNFVDMVNNIGKFTSNNIGLEQSVTAMQGIANWAAISGANANEASRAMYNLAQALSTGTVKLIDWKSIENANMATTEFKETVINIAEEMGTLTKVSDNLWKTLDGKTEVSVENFNEGLSKGWFTKNVLMKALDKYGAATNKLNEITSKYDMTASSLIKDIDRYTKAAEKARKQSEQLGETEEQTQQRIKEATKGIVESVAASWDEVDLESVASDLASFDNELMQFGLKSFKAAQEAKTFTEAIDSVKDAVSTGWMKSFEIIFGDYMQAKEFWTNIANSLYDIFADSAYARNQMLQDWAEADGRNYFLNSIYTMLTLIAQWLVIVKTAWRDVFGQMSGKQLADLTKKLNRFLLKLVLNEEAMSKVVSVFRGFFSVLDIIKTTISRLVTGALDVLNRIFAELNINIGDAAASAGDVVYEFSKWYKQSTFIQDAFKKIGDAAVFVIKQIKSFIETVKNFGPVKTALDKLHSIFGEDVGLIQMIVMAAAGAVQFLWNTIQNFHFPSSLAEAKQMFLDFGQSIIDAFDSIGINMEGVQKIFDKFKDATASAFGTANGIIGKTAALIKSFVDFVKALDIDWAGVLLAGYGVVVLAILWKFTDALKGFAGALSNVTGVGKSAKGAMDSIKNYFTALKNNIQTDNILKMSIALTALAIAMSLLAMLDWKSVLVGVGAVIGLSVAVTLLSYAMSKIGNSGASKGLASTILALAGSMVILVYAIKQIPLEDNTLLKRIGIIAVALVSLSALSIVISRFGGDFVVSAGMMVGIAAAVFILIKTMQSIGREKIGSIYAAVPVVAAVMLALGAMTKLMTATKSITVLDRANKTKTTTKMGSSFGTVIGAVIGIKLMISAIKSLAKEDPGTIAKGMLLMLPVIGLLALLFQSAKAAGKEAAGAGKMILYISAALLLLKPAINGLASMPINALVKGGVVITALSTFIFVPLIKVSKDAGQYAAKAGILVLAITGALMILQLVIKTLGRLDAASLIKGTAAVGAVILAFATVVYASQKRVKEATNVSDVDIWKQMLYIVGVIGALLLALSLINPIGALAAGTGIAAVFLSMAAFMKIITDTKLPEGKTLSKLLGVAVSIGAIIGVIATFGKDWKVALAASAGISMVIVALASMGQILKNSATSEAFSKKMKTLQEFALMLIPLMSILVAVVGAVSMGGGSVSEILYVSTAISEIMIAMGIMAQLMKKMSLPTEKKIEAFGKEMRTLLITAGVIVTLFAAFMAAANSESFNWDISGVLQLTTAVSMLLVAIGAAAKLADGVELPDNLTDNLSLMAIFMIGIGSALAIIMGVVNTVGADISGCIQLASAIGIICVALGAAAAVITKAGGEGSFELAWKQVGTISVLLGAIGLLLAVLSNIVDPIAVLPLAIGISVISIALGKAAQIIAKVPEADLKTAMNVILIMGAIVASMTLLLTILGGLALLPGVQDLLNDGVVMLATIGRGIGAFIGGILGGLAEGVLSAFPQMCAYISDGTEKLIPFFKALESIPGGALGLVAAFIGMVTMITGATFISGLESIPIVGKLMEKGRESLAENFAAFGAALKAFSDSIEGVNTTRVKQAAEAVTMLGSMEMGLNSIGNALGKLFNGSDSLEQFGNRLEKLGEGLSKFAVATKDVNTDSVSGATAAADILVTLEKKLTGHGGIIQGIFGEQDLGKFGARLLQFGVNMKAFAFTVKDVKKEDVEGAKNAGDMLAKLEKSLQPVGGVVQDFFFGNKDLAGFGNRLLQFGTALANFNESVAGEKVNPLEFRKASNAAGYLAELEKTLDTTGGVGAFWSGDSSLDKFGSNLKTFGACLYAFSNQLKATDMPKINEAIEYIERLIGIQDLDETTLAIVDNVKTILSDIRITIENHEVELRNSGISIMRYLAEGFSEGSRVYTNIATRAAVNLANRIVETFRAQLGIHSPSLVMKEQGYYIVDGVAEGIDSNDSAEEAAKKKADNIVSAFNSALSKLTSEEKTSDLEFQLWQLTDGKGASDIEIAQKQQELEMQKLANLAKTVGAKKAAMDTIAEVAGKDSESYQKAYQEYLQAQIDMLNKQKEIDSSLGSTEGTWATKANEFAQYMRDYSETYQMLGKSQEELEAAAYKAVYGLDDEAISRKREYDRIMQEYSASFETLKDGLQDLDRIAKEQSGWEGLPESTSNAMSTTAQVIADNIDAYQVDIQATIEKATADAIKNATGKGSGAGAAAAAGGEDLMEQITDGMQNAMGGGEDGDKDTVLGKISKYLQGEIGDLLTGQFDASNPSSNAAKLVGFAEYLGFEIDESIAEAIIEKAPDVLSAFEFVGENGLEGIKGWYDQYKAGGEQSLESYTEGLKNEEKLNEVKTSAEAIKDTTIHGMIDSEGKAAQEAKNTIDGYVNGLRSYSKIRSGAVKTIASLIPTAAIESIAATQDSNSPSKVTQGLGNDFTAGYSLGIGEDTSGVISSAMSLASNAINALNDKNNIKSAETAGANIGQSFGSGLLSKISTALETVKTTVSSALSKITTSITSAINGMNKSATTSATSVGQNVSKGVAQGMASGATEVAKTAGNVAAGVTKEMAAMLQVKSPSRVTMEIGDYVGLGLAKGIEASAPYVNEATEDLTSNMTSSLDYAAQAVDAILQSDDDYEPVITPVLDLDQLKKDANSIPGYLNGKSGISLNSAQLRVGQIAASKAELERQNGSDAATTVVNNYDMTQNNYSPKALNRVEIYRQTNNQFSRLKGATKL